MKAQYEASKKKGQFFMLLAKSQRKKNYAVKMKRGVIENEAKKLGKERQDILKDTFSEMTRWTVSRPSSRSHTAYDSSIPSRPRSHSTHKVTLNTDASNEEKQLIIHDAFANFISKKQKKFNIGQSTVVIKRKGRLYKGGLGELASQIAQTKPLQAKENSEEIKTQEKSLRFRQSKKLIDPQKEEMLNISESAWRKFIPRGTPFSKEPIKRVSPFTTLQSKHQWVDRLKPWREDEETVPSLFRNRNGFKVNLSDFLE